MITKEIIIDSMETLTRDDLLRLSAFHGQFCISIYIPTHRTGVETLKGQDSLSLKNQLKEIRTKLAEQGLSSKQIEEYINPLLELVNDADFWRHQMEGLAIFFSRDFIEKYILPIQFEPFNYLASDFYLKPLLPVFNDNGKFHLLTLKKDEVRFYDGNKYGLNEIDINDSVPSRLEDVVGYDYEQKQLQFRTQTGSNKPGSFHGHGEGEAKDKNELLLFFREIDRGILSKMPDSRTTPLVLCCLDYFFPIYREASNHKNIIPQHISCNPADLDTRLLHEKARELLMPYFSENFHAKKEKFSIAFEKGRASTNIREIVPAAMQGKIDTIFFEKDKDVYGIYDASTGGINIQENDTPPVVSLTNLIAKKVFEQGGTVYLADRENMPDNSSIMNALYRY